MQKMIRHETVRVAEENYYKHLAICNKTGRGLWFPRSGHVDRAGVDTRVPRGVLVLGELRAAPIRSEWAGALQRGRGTGGEVVRKCGLGC